MYFIKKIRVIKKNIKLKCNLFRRNNNKKITRHTKDQTNIRTAKALPNIYRRKYSMWNTLSKYCGQSNTFLHIMVVSKKVPKNV